MGIPSFVPQECSECNVIISGSMFTKSDALICEDCYWARHYGDVKFVKRTKHHILDTIDCGTSQRICHCHDVKRDDSWGQPRKLFPVEPSDNHDAKCSLLHLDEFIAQAKYQGLLSSGGIRTPGRERSMLGRVLSRSDKSTTSGANKANIPALLRQIAEKEKHPHGYQHMALRVGPLVIENGVAQ